MNEQLLLARGFSRRMLLGLVRRGLATLTYETGGKILDIGKVHITDTGRNALADES